MATAHVFLILLLGLSPAADRDIYQDPKPEDVPAQIEALKGPKRRDAGFALAKIGEPAIKPLVAAVEKPETRNSAFWVLGRIGKPSVPYLVKLLDHEDRKIRSWAVSYLGDLGPDAAPGVPRLIEIARGPDGDHGNTERSAIQTLGDIGPAARAATPTLLDILQNGKPLHQLTAAGAIVRIHGDDGKQALEYLVAKVEDPDESTAGEACHQLGLIGNKHEEVVPALATALKRKDLWIRISAMQALRKLGAGYEKAIPALVETLKDPEPDNRSFAAYLLGELEEKAKSAIPSLVEAAKDPDAEVRKAAQRALGLIDPEKFEKE